MSARAWAEDRFIERAPIGVLASIAARIAPVPRIQTVPGWSFAHGDFDMSASTDFRRKLWRRFADDEVTRPVTVPWHDETRLQLYLGNDLSKLIFVDGSFEPNEFVFLTKCLKPGMTFVDVGANDGAYTVFAARRVGAHGRVVAVEPSSREFKRLTANIELNQLRNVTTVRAAAGEANGTALLAIAEYGHEGQNTVGTTVLNPGVVTARLEEVQEQRLDDILASAGIDRVDFLKIDVEGSEPHVLSGAKETLARHRPILQLELETDWLARQNSSPEDVLRRLDSAGYAVWIFDQATGWLRELQPDDELNANVIAGSKEWRPDDEH